MISEIIEWIETYPFTKPGPCDCDFEGNWLGDGMCVGCKHPTSYFKDGWCTYEITYSMSTKETKEEIIKHLRGLV